MISFNHLMIAVCSYIYGSIPFGYIFTRFFTGKKIFSNRISKEFLPGMIKPLVWSINIPVVNSSWKRLIEEITGKTTIDIYHMAHSFYYRAYFNMGIFGDIFELFGMPRELLEIMLGLILQHHHTFNELLLQQFCSEKCLEKAV